MTQIVDAREKAEALKPVLVSKREACRLLGDICVRTLENWINAKLLRAKRVGGRTMISYAEIERFAARK